MQPAGIVTSSEVVAARKTVTQNLRDKDVSDYDLILASFGVLSDEVREKAEARLQEHDPTHAPGKKNLVELLCASAVMSGLEADNDQAVDLALLAESAMFRGMKPRIKSMPEAVATVISRSAARSRSRLQSKKPSERTQVPDQSEPIDPAAINALSARIEKAIAHFDLQLQLLNEEVDVLWWARSGRSESGQRWSDLSESDRAVEATAEVAALAISYPITGAVFEVLRDVVDGPKRKSETLLNIAILASAASAFPTLDESRLLLPLLSATRIARTYPEDARGGVIAAELKLDSATQFKIADVPGQLLRELAIVNRVL